MKSGPERWRAARLLLLGGASLAIVSGCTDAAPAVDPSIFADLGQPLGTLSEEERAQFERGREVAQTRFDVEGGLGPLFSATSCLACHEKPVFGGSASRYRESAIRVTGGEVLLMPFEAQYSVEDVRSANAPGRAESRSPQPFFGLGLLGEIPDAEILRGIDLLDEDGDGISGRVNFERGHIGRFGRKAQMATLAGFVRLALLDHLGITTPGIEAADGQVPGPLELPTADLDAAADPELDRRDTEDLIAFVTHLGAPRPDVPTSTSLAGETRFDELGCTGCHFASLTGPRGPIPAYTDLLLHDMGEDLSDGVHLNEASGSEFRTQPLWGISAVGPYLHDGRADSLDEAILWHGGEAESSRGRYEALDFAERQEVIAFLRSLGGNDHRSQGLLPLEPNDDDVPPGLSAEERSLFDVGRELFDHDFGLNEGLGPLFNGDACRSCHFDGGIGGAGPSDVDVVRFVDAGETPIAHRHRALEGRPATEMGEFVRRQTPALFGLGLVERIAEATILAGADPNDLDGDGIRGRASILSDGRIGRFGWKADVPTLVDFSRDALSAEMGMTVPVSATSSFGVVSDDDDAADPEVTAEDIEALTFFMATLPAPVAESDPVGAEVFGRAGCADCHAPSMPTADGVDVPLYSDLLLHDVSDGELFRTPPLWGLSASGPYMHDGSAQSAEVAIAKHGGEAAASRRVVEALGSDERASLLRFLEAR